jgi:hypothetical protein
MKTTRYQLQYDHWKAIVSIADHPRTMVTIRAEVDCWPDGAYRLNAADGDYAGAFLGKLIIDLLLLSMEMPREAIIDVLDGDGWPTLDGTTGICLEEIDEFKFDERRVSIQEVAPATETTNAQPSQ